MGWFVLRTRYGREVEIARSVNDLGHRIFCPTYRSTDVIRGKKTVRLRPVWATYVLVDWPSDDAYAWHDVMCIDGVLGVIGGEHPIPVLDREIADLLRGMDTDGVVGSLDALIRDIRRGYVRGDRVRIIADDHPFNGQIGTCSWYDNAGVSVKISCMGREINLYVPSVNARVVRIDDAVVQLRSRKRRDRRRILSEMRRVST